MGRHDEAISASRAAPRLEPRNQKLVNDLGWSLYESGRGAEAIATLERAVAMDRDDELAGKNLRVCRRDADAGNRPKTARGKKRGG